MKGYRIKRYDLSKRYRKRRLRRVIWLLFLILIGGGLYYFLIGHQPSSPQKETAVKSAPKKIIPKEKAQKKPKPLKSLQKGRPKEISIVAVGDIIMDRSVAAMIRTSGADEPFRAVGSFLKETELTIANLENPLSTKGARLSGKDVTFRGTPAGVQGIKNAGIDVVSLANNHSLDYGPEALQETLGLLDQQKIYHAGAGLNATQATKASQFKVGNKKVSFLAYSYIIPGGFYPTENKAGIAPARPNPQAMMEQIKKAKKSSDFVIVYFHWGKEYVDYLLSYQPELAHQAVEAGADLVLGAHPHVIQGIEIYKGKLIAYSLGDFVFDHYSRKTGETFILKVKLSSKSGLLEAKMIPVYITSAGQPGVVKGQEANQILTRLAAMSAKLGTQIKIEQDQGAIIIPQ